MFLKAITFLVLLSRTPHYVTCLKEIRNITFVNTDNLHQPT